MTNPAKKGRAGRLIKVAALLAVVLAVVVAGFAMFWVAPTPPMFDQSVTLSAAEESAAGSGKYVLAVSTANWCAMCQVYKRGALTDDRVEQWVTDNAVPVYVNIGEQAEAAARLKVEGKAGQLPVTTLLRDGEVVANHVGVMDADALLAWLQSASAASAPAPAVSGV